MIGQALTNLIKNAGEAIEEVREKNPRPGYVPEIRVAVEPGEAFTTITIADNGTGLPPDRSRLFEPYVTTREKGTGLGLSIVKEISSEYQGAFGLSRAPIGGISAVILMSIGTGSDDTTL